MSFILRTHALATANQNEERQEGSERKASDDQNGGFIVQYSVRMF